MIGPGASREGVQGFPAGYRSTPVPNPLLSSLLEEINDLDELKITLRAIWFLHQRRVCKGDARCRIRIGADVNGVGARRLCQLRSAPGVLLGDAARRAKFLRIDPAPDWEARPDSVLDRFEDVIVENIVALKGLVLAERWKLIEQLSDDIRRRRNGDAKFRSWSSETRLAWARLMLAILDDETARGEVDCQLLVWLEILAGTRNANPTPDQPTLFQGGTDCLDLVFEDPTHCSDGPASEQSDALASVDSPTGGDDQ